MKPLIKQLLRGFKLLSAALDIVLGLGILGWAIGMLCRGQGPRWASALALIPGLALLLIGTATFWKGGPTMSSRKYQSYNPGGSGQNPANLVILVVFFVIGVFVLIPLFLPFGLVWCIVIGKALLKELKNQGVVKTNVEGKLDVDWNKAKASSQRSFDQVRAYSKDAAAKYKQHVSESDRMDEKLPRDHPHTPVNYSYDSCAREKRLEQLKNLKDAGILEETEYKRRRQDILSGK